MASSAPIAADEAPAAIAATLAGVTRAGGRVAVVGIDGRSGSGKTTLAAALARVLEAVGPVTVLPMDDVYPGWDGLAEACARLVDDVLAPLRTGEVPRVRRWDWAAGAEDEWQDVQVSPGGVFVVEGVGACGGEARPYLDVAVWVAASEAVRRARAIDRDGDTYAPHWERWAAQERRYVASERPDRAADIVVDGAVRRA